MKTFKTTVTLKNGKEVVYKVRAMDDTEAIKAAGVNWPDWTAIRVTELPHEHIFESVDCARPMVCACGEVRS